MKLSDHQYNKYRGMCQNQHPAVSAKKLRPKQRVAVRDWLDCKNHVRIDKFTYEEKVWSCRRSDTSVEASVPGKGYMWVPEGGWIAYGCLSTNSGLLPTFGTYQSEISRNISGERLYHGLKQRSAAISLFSPKM